MENLEKHWFKTSFAWSPEVCIQSAVGSIANSTKFHVVEVFCANVVAIGETTRQSFTLADRPVNRGGAGGANPPVENFSPPPEKMCWT